MQQCIILDANVIAKAPEILFKKPSCISLVVPHGVHIEILSKSKPLFNLIEKASQKNTVKIINEGNLDLKTNLSQTDNGLITLAHDLAKTYDDVAIATYNRKIIKWCELYKIKTYNAESLLALIAESETAEANTSITEMSARPDTHQKPSYQITDLENNGIEEYKQNQISKFLRLISFGVVFFVVFVLVFAHFAQLSKMTIDLRMFVAIIVSLLAGICFYAFRCYHLSYYAVDEIAVGTSATVIASEIYASSIGKEKFDLSAILSLLAGLYITVRGLTLAKAGEQLGKVAFGKNGLNNETRDDAVSDGYVQCKVCKALAKNFS